MRAMRWRRVWPGCIWRKTMSDESLIRLATAAGLSVDWTDADNRRQRVEPQVLREVLGCLGLAAHSEADVQASLELLAHSTTMAACRPC